MKLTVTDMGIFHILIYYKFADIGTTENTLDEIMEVIKTTYKKSGGKK